MTRVEAPLPGQRWRYRFDPRVERSIVWNRHGKVRVEGRWQTGTIRRDTYSLSEWLDNWERM